MPSAASVAAHSAVGSLARELCSVRGAQDGMKMVIKQRPELHVVHTGYVTRLRAGT